jgi:hypothetical protein
MRKNAIKTVLFSLSSLGAFTAHAAELPEGLHLIEELPVEQRVIAHAEVLKYLNQHPESAADAKFIAFDRNGTVYVLNEKMENSRDAGQPSCIGRP